MSFTPKSDSVRRVVITGMGAVTPVGLTLDDLWEACSHHKSGVIPYHLGGSEPIPVKYAAPALPFTGNPADFGEIEGPKKKDLRKSLKLMSREIQMGIASAERALQDAQITQNQIDPSRVGVSFSADYILSTLDDLTAAVKACRNPETGKFDFTRWALEGKPKMQPLWQLKYLTNMITSHISILNQFYGIGANVTNREASIGAAVGEGAEKIKHGELDMMVVGATGSRLHPMRLIAAILNDKLALDPSVAPEEASRPFDKNRIGEVLGEGAGALILEEEEHARERGAQIYGEVIGGSCRSVIKKNPNPKNGAFFAYESFEGIQESLTLTLKGLFKKTGWTPAQIGHINAHGLATPVMDAAEASAIRDVFGDFAGKIPLTTLKGHFGNLGAGSGAVELIASLLAFKNNALFPIMNNKTDDPACPILPVREMGISPGDAFIKTACHSYGQTSALLIARYQG